MKRKLFFVSIFIMLAFAGFGQGISGSAHDFSATFWNQSNELCIVCHTPHNAKVVADAPLWNHTTTSSVYTLYSSPTFNGAATIGQPDGSSKLCLSCHDGTVALENFSGTTDGTNFIGSFNNFGTDLSNDHPISFTYNTALSTADHGLYDPSTQSSGIGTSINADMLYNGKMQCASCHDVHNNSGGNASLLRKSNVGSALCLTCHNK